MKKIQDHIATHLFFFFPILFFKNSFEEGGFEFNFLYFRTSPTSLKPDFQPNCMVFITFTFLLHLYIITKDCQTMSIKQPKKRRFVPQILLMNVRILNAEKNPKIFKIKTKITNPFCISYDFLCTL